MNTRVLVNGLAEDRVPALDRGLAYGDGLFETIRVLEGEAPLLDRHLARLREGCARLHLPMPDPDALRAEVAQVASGIADAVVKIVLTRGVGARGYAPTRAGAATRIVAAFAMPALPVDWCRDGITVRCCALRLAAQPALAGIKHLNRLEQVLARAEWDDPAISEGLLFDADDRLVCATAANVFVVVAGSLRTPPLDACGVAGVLRGSLLDALPGAAVAPIARDELMRADELFLTSSVRGVLPVRALDGRVFGVGPHAHAAQAIWRGFGFPGGGA